MSEAERATIDVLLTPEQLLFLGRYAEGEASPCSPFFGKAAAETLPGPALDDLFRRGLLTPQAVEPRLLWALGVLKSAGACGGIEVRADEPQAEAACYFSPAGACALLSHAGGLRLVSPPPRASLDALVREAFGTGTRRVHDLALDLPASDSRVLAGALDLLRRSALAGLLDARPEPLSQERLAAWLARRDLAAQWLTPHVAPLLERGGLAFDPHSVPGAIEGLVARGLLCRTRGRLLGAGKGLGPLVRHLLLLDRVVALRAGRADAGRTPERVEILAVKASSPALLLIEPYGRGFVHWSAASAAAARSLAATLLEDGRALGGAAVAVSS